MGLSVQPSTSGSTLTIALRPGCSLPHRLSTAPDVFADWSRLVFANDRLALLILSNTPASCRSVSCSPVALSSGGLPPVTCLTAPSARVRTWFPIKSRLHRSNSTHAPEQTPCDIPKQGAKNTPLGRSSLSFVK